SNSPKTPAAAAVQIEAISEQADAVMTEDDLANLPPPPPVPTDSTIDPLKLWNRAHEAQELFARANARAKEAEAKAQELEQRAREHEEQLRRRDDELREQKNNQSRKELEIAKRESEIVAKDEDLTERERGAELGFLTQRRAALAKFEDEAK